MSISASDVKALRQRTGSGIMDCKNALAETDGDIDKAVEYLQKKGIAKAAKRAGRTATDGLVHAYIHTGGKVGVLLEVNCETDFVARGDIFQSFVNDVALHIAAMNPEYLDDGDIDAAAKAKQLEIFEAQALDSGKPEHIVDKIVEGRMRKWAAEICLKTQPFVKDPDKTIGSLETETTASIGEKVSIRRYVRFELGEGLEKRQDDFAAEVAAAAAN